MTDAPFVSVVMCSYNGLATIDRAIGSILAQSYSNWELVVSDDGSTDGTRDYLATLRDPRIRILLRPANIGYVANKHAALALAKGDLITQQDQDDFSVPTRLAQQVEAIVRTELAIVGCGYCRVGLGRRQVVAPDREIVVDRPSTLAYPFWFPALMVRREVYAKVGYFDPYFAGAFGDDLYWTVKANEQFPILCLPNVLYDYRDCPGSITSVAGSDRKLVIGEIFTVLLAQRRDRGRDDL